MPRANREAKNESLVHSIASTLMRGLVEETRPTTCSQLLAIGRPVSLLSLSLRSRQMIDLTRLPSPSPGSSQFVDRALLLCLSLCSRQFMDRSPFLAQFVELALNPSQCVDRFLLLSLSLRSRQFVGQSPFLAFRFARVNWWICLCFIVSRFARGNKWTGFSFLAYCF